VKDWNKAILIILTLFLLQVLATNDVIPKQSKFDESEISINEAISILSTSTDLPINSTFLEDECSSVIVTGSAAKDGRAILMKNRDWSLEPQNRPIYTPAEKSNFAYVGVNSNTMGINEKGLALMNTAMPELESEPGLGNLNLNQRLLEEYESVAQVARDLNNSRSFIGPTYRSSMGTIATCIGIVDRFGVGAFFEISNTEAYVQYIVDGYDTRANHPRIFAGHEGGPSGRDQYLLDILDAVYEKNGVITWEDIMQNASRYVRNKELGSTPFSIDGEACNEATVAAMVAVSGDDRYDGRLNVMWGAYGPTPLVSVFVPSMVAAGDTPGSTSSLWYFTNQKYQSAQVQSNPILLDPYRIREIQDYAFFAEEYSIDAFDSLLSCVPEGLSDYQLQDTLRDFITRVDDYAAEVFIEESFSISVPDSVTFPTPTVVSTTTSTATGTSSIYTNPSETNPSSSTSSNESSPSPSAINVDISVFLGFGIGGAISIVVVLIFIKKNQ